MYAIIATGGKQYKVSEGDVIRVEKLPGEIGDKIVLDQVLMISDKKSKIGNPYVKGASVDAEIADQGKERKVIVYKFKSKTGYHKKNGHRQPYTALKINKISASAPKQST